MKEKMRRLISSLHPSSCRNFMSVGFKEWAIVCEALGRGDQSIILRKGGIAEGRDGFRFKHDAFYLFPTLFHEQIGRTTLPPGTPIPAQEPGMIKIDFFARAEWTAEITDWEIAKKLAPFHIWKESVIGERFRYDEKQGLSLAFVRVFRLAPAWIFPDAPAFGGCRSWVALPEPPKDETLSPVLDDPTHAAREEALRALLAR